MGKSFQDQMLKAGLVNKQQLNESKSSKHKQKKHNKKVNLSKQQKQALSEQEQCKQAKDLQLNQRLEAQRLNKARSSEIKQLITASQVDCKDGDVAYKFSDQGTIKQIYVSSQVKNELAADRLQIARFKNSYVVISTAIADSILQRDPEYAVIKNQGIESDDDGYGDYQVPDDLTW